MQVDAPNGSHVDFAAGFLEDYPFPGFGCSFPASHMELLLNLIWLLMALPAYWLWRASRRAPLRLRASSLQCLLALGCALVLLFPVISATDDLHVMRAEMDESQPGKRSVRQAASDRSSLGTSRLQSPPALLSTLDMPALSGDSKVLVLRFDLTIPTRVPALQSGRAPPFPTAL
jgi:hypothetical protein